MSVYSAMRCAAMHLCSRARIASKPRGAYSNRSWAPPLRSSNMSPGHGDLPKPTGSLQATMSGGIPEKRLPIPCLFKAPTELLVRCQLDDDGIVRFERGILFVMRVFLIKLAAYSLELFFVNK